jgi:Tol biopolymer transport system component
MRSLVITIAHAVIVALLCSGSRAVAQVTSRVSIDSNGAQSNGSSDYGTAISADGRFVVFASNDDLVPEDTNGFRDVFVRDRMLAETTCVSVDPNGIAGNAGSGYFQFPYHNDLAITPDGRFVAFTSWASNLVPGDTNNQMDVFVRDRWLGTTVRASVSSSGVEGNDQSFDPAISADGRFVSFTSYADNLVPGDHPYCGQFGCIANDVFVHDMISGETTMVNLDENGYQNGPASQSSISGDGRYVAFTCSAPLVSGDTGLCTAGCYDCPYYNCDDIYVRDLIGGITTRISVAPGNQNPDGDSRAPAFSVDGNLIAFESHATNLVAGDTNGYADIFVVDRRTGVITRASVDSSGAESNGDSYTPAIDSAGRVAFVSYATNLSSSDINGSYDVFVHDFAAGTTWQASVSTPGVGGDGRSWAPSISLDGRFVTFTSGSTNLVPNDTNQTFDAFVHGEELTLEASPTTVSAGQPITITTYLGPAGNTASLWAVQVNGSPIFAPIFIGRFGADGLFQLSAPVPDGLGTVDVTLRGYAIGSDSRVAATNDVIVSLR